MTISNQTTTPVDDVELDVAQSYADRADAEPNNTGWHKKISWGTCKAMLTTALEETFPIDAHPRVRFDIFMPSRLRSFRETIEFTQQDDHYVAVTRFYEGGEVTYTQTLAVSIARASPLVKASLPSKQPSFVLVLDCQQTPAFPVAPRSRTYFIDIDFPKGLSSLLSGPKERIFPRSDFDGVGYKCEVLNYNAQAAINVSGVFGVAVGDMIYNGSAGHSGTMVQKTDCRVDIPVIESNGKRDFYAFVLDSRKYAQVTPPRTVTLELNDRPGKIEAELRQTSSTFDGQILIYGPPPRLPSN